MDKFYQVLSNGFYGALFGALTSLLMMKRSETKRTEAMLNGLLAEVKEIKDLLEGKKDVGHYEYLTRGLVPKEFWSSIKGEVHTLDKILSERAIKLYSTITARNELIMEDRYNRGRTQGAHDRIISEKANKDIIKQCSELISELEKKLRYKGWGTLSNS